ncbi:MAG: hypothetical protein COA91_12455 [Robiginitomaculum sp.]|nr:MAG: hypothetical protein COA91_12455 [Robiginitomaculum sp.]
MMEKFKPFDKELVRAAMDSPFRDVIECEEFRRLKNISFLGAIDTWLTSRTEETTGNSNRYHHSIGVYSIALFISKFDTNIPKNEIKLFQAVALLHDLGHAPLSHSVEFLFEKQFGLNHHKNTNNLINNRKSQLFVILRSMNIQPSDITLALDKKVNLSFSKYFNGHFNIDTLDGIYRCFSILNKKPDFSLNQTIKASLLTYNANKNEIILDSFWRMKGYVYNLLIYDGFGRIADELAQNHVAKRIDLLREEMFMYSDQEFFSVFPELENEISSDVSKATSGHYPNHLERYRHRNFSIREKCHLKSYRDICGRYYQETLAWEKGRSDKLRGIIPTQEPSQRELAF